MGRINDNSQNISRNYANINKSYNNVGNSYKSSNVPEEDEENLSFAKQIQRHKEELYQKIIRGETEEKFRIGSQSLSVREWNRLLESFDECQEDIAEDVKDAAKSVENHAANSVSNNILNNASKE